MKRIVSAVPGLLLTVWANGAAAGSPPQIEPRYAEPVQPRYAEPVRSRAAPVQPRSAAPVQPRFADEVQSRAEPPAANTAVVGTRVDAWTWQELGNSSVGAASGLGRNTQLSDIRCAGLVCKFFESTGGGWLIQGEGGFPDIGGGSLDVQLINLGTQKLQADSRFRGVFSNGRFWDSIETYDLPAADYAVFYKVAGQERVVAVMRFKVRRSAPAEPPAGQRTGRTANPAANAELIQRARRNALCLGAAMNPDVRCVPGGY